MQFAFGRFLVWAVLLIPTLVNSTKIRLHGKHSYEGKVEVYLAGHWKFVSEQGWGLTESRVVCRMLGFPGVERYLIRWVTPKQPPVACEMNLSWLLWVTQTLNFYTCHSVEPSWVTAWTRVTCVTIEWNLSLFDAIPAIWRVCLIGGHQRSSPFRWRGSRVIFQESKKIIFVGTTVVPDER